MEVRRCMSCMKEISGTVCEHCGYNPASATANTLGLKPETFLHGRYLVGKILGQGGFGITYVGFDMVLNIKVAIKEYFPAGCASRDHTISNKLQWTGSQLEGDAWKEGCDHFLKEARRMAQIDSIPGIVRVRDTFFDNNTAYIIMDFIEGITLKSYLSQNGVMPLSQCVSMLNTLFMGLASVNKQGLIHRDISPDNIILQPDGNLKLLDFGAAKDMETMREGLSQMVTKKGFSPPEQYMEQGNIGSWTDVYALTATIYYCITGKLTPDAMDRVMNDPLTFNVQTIEPLTPQIVDVLSRGMAVKVENRIPTADELMNELNMAIFGEAGGRIAGQQAHGAGKSGKAAKNNKKSINGAKKGKLKWIIIAASVLLVLVAGGVTLAVLKPWRVYVKTLGNTNSNVLNDGGFAIVSGKREYFTDHNNNLYECIYDAQDGCFYVDKAEIIGEKVNYITLSDDAIYYISTSDDEGRLMEKKFGEEAEVLYTGSNGMNLLQYALLSNDDEYLYFIDMGENENFYVYRYDLKSQNAETVIEDDVVWFNLYDEYIFYTAFEDNETKLVRTNLKGKKEKVLQSEGRLSLGFVENDTIYLYSMDEKAIITMDLDGNKTGGLYDAKMDSSFFTFAYGADWIYYVNEEDGAIHRIRTNNSGDELVLDGHYAISICYAEDCVWFSEGMNVGGETVLTRAYMMNKDGSGLVPITDADIRTTDDGIQYKLSGNEAIICGYVGDKYVVGLPLQLDGYFVYSIEEDSLPQGHDYFIIGYESDFEYHTNDAGDGVIVDGYTGNVTWLMIPETLGGLPVTEIGEEAFRETDIEKLALPSNVVKVDDYAFYMCESLYDVQLNDGILGLGICSFAACTCLEGITLPEGIQEIGIFAFGKTGITEIYVPASVSNIGATAFCTCNTITISPDNPNYKLENNAIYTIDGRTLVEVIASTTGEYVVSEGVEIIGYEAFYMCESLSSIVLPETVTEIKGNACWYCSKLESIYIPRSVKIIREDAFSDCDSLTEITIAEDCVTEDLGKPDLQINYYEPDGTDGQ